MKKMYQIKQYDVNVMRLQQLERITFTSYVQLFREVIEVNGVPFETFYQKDGKVVMPPNDKVSILAALGEFATIEPVGARRCFVKSVIGNGEEAEKEYIVNLKAIKKFDGKEFKTVNKALKAVLCDKFTGKPFDEKGFTDEQLENFKQQVEKHAELEIYEDLIENKEGETRIISKIKINMRMAA